MGSFDEVYKQRNFGNKGEFALQYLDRVSNYSTESIIIPSHESAEDDSIRYNVTAWMGEISPGVNIEFNLFENIGKMGLSYNFDDVVGPVRNFKPTNVGFGLTYVLPVVISLLTAKKGDIIIIENPEAHLHPRGQSRMGKLISEVANAGVQVFVETHSDHVLNGIRVATKNNKIEADKVKIYYFDRSDESYKQYHATKAYQLKLDQNGNIDKWPDGFFDEWDNMLDELM
jgi:predicted ATPase